MLNNYSVKYQPFSDPLSEMFAALSDPTRRSILDRLSKQDISVNELAEPYPMSLPAVSKHIKVLEKAGLISKRRQAQQRLCHLEAAKLAEATQWLANYRDIWTANLGSLDSYLQEVQLTDKE